MAGNRKLGFMRGAGKGTTQKSKAQSIFIDVAFKVDRSGRWKGDISSSSVRRIVKKELIEGGFEVKTDKESGDWIVTKKEAA